jgi:hypothetical protein
MPLDIPVDHDGDATSPAVVNSKAHEKQNFYYAFDYKFVHVVALSIKDDFAPGSDQFKWLEQDLAAAQARTKTGSIKWIIVIGHTPMYSSSNGHTGGNQALKEAVEPLMYKYNVTFGIWGDDHNYERTFPIYRDDADITPADNSGTIPKFANPAKPIHLLVGTGGIGLDGWASPVQPPWSAFREIAHGYLKMSCSRLACKAQFIRVKDDGDEEVADDFIVVKQVPFLTSSHLFIWLLPLAALFVLLVKKNVVTLPATPKRFL